MKFEIEGQAAQKLLDYLAVRPYNEVFPLVALLQNLKPLVEKKEEENVSSLKQPVAEGNTNE